MARHGAQRPASRKAKEDESIMGTNNSSIVSKRSVERLYYPEPHFFRYFVKKPQRRSPLINRGYWLRMHAIDQVVHQFLQDDGTLKRKVVINLGCGYDPVPFQWLARHPQTQASVLFVDVDYPELMAKKLDMIRATPQLCSLIDDSASPSEKYVAVGCDLANIGQLETQLARHVDFAESMVLCTAEVSMTYMDLTAADALIEWAGRKPDMQFCLLEQYLSAGSDHPFAAKMLEHFKKLNTPLRCIDRYPKLSHQRDRFKTRGWTDVRARSLWELWTDPEFTSIDQRQKLETVEAFDEWEEFMLFASHYCCIMASTTSLSGQIYGQQTSTALPDHTTSSVIGHVNQDAPPLQMSQEVLTLPSFRFGTAFQSKSYAGYFGGLGAQTRSNDTAIFQVTSSPQSQASQTSSSSSTNLLDMRVLKSAPSRMCHTISCAPDGTALLVGGRASPERPLQDCWYFTGESWTQVEDLPFPLFRHCAVAVELVVNADGHRRVCHVVAGGKTAGNKISDEWLLWEEKRGWSRVAVSEPPAGAVRPTFGAAMTLTPLSGTREGACCEGIYIGGMTDAGEISSTTLLEWKVSFNDSKFKVDLAVSPLSVSDSSIQPFRMGAKIACSNGRVYMIGGVADKPAPDVLELTRANDAVSSSWTATAVHCSMAPDTQIPLLTGHSLLTTNEALFVLGGGAVCFSFGTHWNKTISRLQLQDTPRTATLSTLHTTKPKHTAVANAPGEQRIELVESVRLDNPETFQKAQQSARPIIFRDADLGACRHTWTLPGMTAKIGADRKVTVHCAEGDKMNFLQKNFSYQNKTFAEFARDVTQGEPQYLRSLSAENPTNEPANVARDFPELARDFHLPAAMADTVSSLQHSSVLRVSGPVAMWLHYDVMANVLCQVQGVKHLRLFHPADVAAFDIPAGGSSSSANVFAPDFAAAVQSHGNGKVACPTAYDAVLHPGDVLYIPPLWLHAARPRNGVSVAVNVFFRDPALLPGSTSSSTQPGEKTSVAGAASKSPGAFYAHGRDVYGNRDLAVYEKARVDLHKMVKTFTGDTNTNSSSSSSSSRGGGGEGGVSGKAKGPRLPRQMAQFYLGRLAAELDQLARQV